MVVIKYKTSENTNITDSIYEMIGYMMTKTRGSEVRKSYNGKHPSQ